MLSIEELLRRIEDEYKELTIRLENLIKEINGSHWTADQLTEHKQKIALLSAVKARMVFLKVTRRTIKEILEERVMPLEEGMFLELLLSDEEANIGGE